MYRIKWTDKVHAELRAIWNSASGRDDQLLIWAVADIAFRLERNRASEGESRPQNT